MSNNEKLQNSKTVKYNNKTIDNQPTEDLIVSTIKSKRVTSNPIINKNKLNTIHKVFNEYLIFKNNSSIKFNQNKFYIDLLFKNKSKELLSIYKDFKTPLLSSWKIQKFINFYLLEKEKERLDRKINFFKSKLYKRKFNKKEQKFINEKYSTKLSIIIDSLVRFEYYKHRLPKSHKSYKSFKNGLLLSLKPYPFHIQKRIIKLKNLIIFNMKNKLKPINYTTGSLIKSNQKELGKHPRLIIDETNSTYKHYYLFDYRDSEDNFKKKFIKVPLSINENYHGNFKIYSTSLGKNKFNKKNNKSKNKKDIQFKIVKNDKEHLIDNLLEVEHVVSLSKSTKRLNISLTHQSDYQFKEQDKLMGIDVGGTLNNTIATSNDDLFGFEHLPDILEKLNNIDKDEKYKILNDKNTIIKQNNYLIESLDNCIKPNNYLSVISKFPLWESKIGKYNKLNNKIYKLPNQKFYSTLKTFLKVQKAKKLSKVFLENQFQINKIVSEFLDECLENNIYDIVMEDLEPFNSLGNKKSKELKEKHNRIFRLLRMSGLVNIFRSIGRNKGIRVHVIPAYYTSKWCRECGNIEDSNRNKNTNTFCCTKCNHKHNDADINAAYNIVDIFRRFRNVFCKVNEFGEYDVKKYLKKDFIKETLLQS